MIILVVLLHQEAGPDIDGIKRLTNSLSSVKLRGAFIITDESHLDLPIGANQVLDVVVGGHD